MRVLVTGAGGQLGTALRRVSGERRVGNDRSGGDEWLFTDVVEAAGTTVGLNITDREAVKEFFEWWRPDVVVNCAAFTDVDRAETEREAAFRVNRDAPRFLAEAAVRLGAALIHISTDFVFDGNGRNADGGFIERSRPYAEDDTPAPLNVYGESKLAGEKAVMESGVRGVVVRTSWLYSPWGKNFVKAIMRVAAERDEIRVVGDQSGCPTSAMSLAEAIAELATAAAVVLPTPAQLYHFCDAGVVSRADFADEIIRQAGIECRVVPVTSAEYPSAAKRPMFSALDTSKITRDFGIAPRPWREPLAECLKELKNGR